MPVTIEQIPEEPIIVSTFKAPFDPLKDLPQMFGEINQLRANFKENTVFIYDAAGIPQVFSDMVQSIAHAAAVFKANKTARASITAHYIFVGTSELVALAADAMSQEQYGGVKVHLCTSRDEAITFARSELLKS